MNTTHKHGNLYSFSFKVNNVEYGHHLKKVIIDKKVSTNNFVEDTYIFDDKATKLINSVLSPVSITLTNNTSSSPTIIYKSEGYISQVKPGDDITVYYESNYKTDWFRKNGVSIAVEHKNIKDVLNEYIEKIDSFYKHKDKTKFNFNYTKNINKHIHENIVISNLNNHFKNLKHLAKKYYLLDSPYYLFFDEYDFVDKSTNFSVNVYDLSNIKSLRASLFSELKSTTRPLFQKAGVYYDGTIEYKINKLQQFYDTTGTYSGINYTGKWDPKNRFQHTTVHGTIPDAQKRAKNIKEFYKKINRYQSYKIDDIDITKFVIGNRFVDDESSAKIQYSQAIVDTKFTFESTGAQDAIKHQAKFINNMKVKVDFVCVKS